MKAQINQQLTQAEIPIEVIHLCNFMTVNKLSIQDMFKIVANQPITETTTINERTFDQCCQERGYDPKDRSKLI